MLPRSIADRRYFRFLGPILTPRPTPGKDVEFSVISSCPQLGLEKVRCAFRQFADI
jgi:hypothetical protein